MSREVRYDEEAICDGCGNKGAFDFYGDFFCEDCTEKIIRKQREEMEDEDE